ncbi:hypothetical protein F4561_002565 [Lipingzhangella halophila]|uniref:Uncharacterized protein n=1 Tax=Lipingzhangella halophila TaxID=1783352 RepID=A0A7W7RH11_9ACTN|nr:hypothetical protein [Lipingzhangella halophila]MBB4931745.1 hypothetical protein [Lipingzhangella halophila]
MEVPGVSVPYAPESELRATLVLAEKPFQELHGWISAGNPLPESWRMVRLAKPLSNGFPSDDQPGV